jgi:tetratricopeptide (TPR) repeat protein
LASEKLGELAIANGTPDQASRFFDVLGKSPFDDFKVKGNYLSGKALLANKQLPEARAKFSLVAQSQVSDPISLKYKKLASLAAVRCDAAEGKTPQAIEALEKMVDEGDSTDAELFAELFNALGGILRSAGNNDEAILAFLKTDLLYATEQDAHAEALYNLSQLWAAIGENQRATEAKSRLSKLYPTSPWLKK